MTKSAEEVAAGLSAEMQRAMLRDPTSYGAQTHSRLAELGLIARDIYGIADFTPLGLEVRAFLARDLGKAWEGPAYEYGVSWGPEPLLPTQDKEAQP